MRKLFFKIHLWLSFPFALIIAVICFTGAIMVFKPEIKQITHSERYFVKEVKGATLPLSALMSMAQAQLPDSLVITGVKITPEQDRTYEITIKGMGTSAFIDPYTGEVVGYDDNLGFFRTVVALHRRLLDRHPVNGSFSIGKAIVGWTTVAFLIILFSGLVLWFPHAGQSLGSRLGIKVGHGWYRFWHDTHVSGGFYASWFLIVMAATGLTWSFGAYRDLFYGAFGVGQEVVKEARMEARSRKGISVDRVIHWDKVKDHLTALNPEYISLTIKDGSANLVSSTLGNSRASDEYRFDVSTGEVTKCIPYSEQSRSSKIKGWVYSLHTGTWGGPVTRVLYFLASLLGGMAALSGYYMWWKSLKHKLKYELY